MTKTKTKLITCQQCTYQHEVPAHIDRRGSTFFCWKCDGVHMVGENGDVRLANGQELIALQAYEEGEAFSAALAFCKAYRDEFGERRPSFEETLRFEEENAKRFGFKDPGKVVKIRPQDVTALLNGLMQAAKPAEKHTIDGTGCLHCIMLDIFHARRNHYEPIGETADVCRALGQFIAISMKPELDLDRYMADLQEIVRTGYNEARAIQAAHRGESAEGARPTCH